MSVFCLRRKIILHNCRHYSELQGCRTGQFSKGTVQGCHAGKYNRNFFYRKEGINKPETAQVCAVY